MGRPAAIGPEMVAGAADNDPTNVGTAAVVGARTVYRLSWVALLVAPLLGVVQTIAAQVGVIGRGDLQSLTVRRYGQRVGAVLVVSVLAVNLVTIAADVEAGAAGTGLLLGVDARWLVAPLGGALAGLLLIGRYDHVVKVLRFLLLGFLAFGAAAILAHPDWPSVLRASVVPSMRMGRDDVAGALALLGTTLTSYVYIWETVERGVEEPTSGTAARQILPRTRGGAVVAAMFTALTLWFMLVASGATLGRHHLTVASADDAARALRPVAGTLAADLYAAGLLVSALVALPILMATTAYVVGAQFDWRSGLSQRVGRARGFYGVIAASIGAAVAVTMAGVPVLSMLVFASVIGGFATPIGLLVLVGLARDPDVMGDSPISRRLTVAGWTVAVVVGGFGLLLIVGAAVGKL